MKKLYLFLVMFLLAFSQAINASAQRKYNKFDLVKFWNDTVWEPDGIHFTNLQHKDLNKEGQPESIYSKRNLNKWGFNYKRSISTKEKAVLFYQYLAEDGLPVYRRGASIDDLYRIIKRPKKGETFKINGKIPKKISATDTIDIPINVLPVNDPNAAVNTSNMVLVEENAALIFLRDFLYSNNWDISFAPKVFDVFAHYLWAYRGVQLSSFNQLVEIFFQRGIHSWYNELDRALVVSLEHYFNRLFYNNNLYSNMYFQATNNTGYQSLWENNANQQQYPAIYHQTPLTNATIVEDRVPEKVDTDNLNKPVGEEKTRKKSRFILSQFWKDSVFEKDGIHFSNRQFIDENGEAKSAYGITRLRRYGFEVNVSLSTKDKILFYFQYADKNNIIYYNKDAKIDELKDVIKKRKKDEIFMVGDYRPSKIKASEIAKYALEKELDIKNVNLPREPELIETSLAKNSVDTNLFEPSEHLEQFLFPHPSTSTVINFWHPPQLYAGVANQQITVYGEGLHVPMQIFIDGTAAEIIDWSVHGDWAVIRLANSYAPGEATVYWYTENGGFEHQQKLFFSP